MTAPSADMDDAFARVYDQAHAAGFTAGYQKALAEDSHDSSYEEGFQAGTEDRLGSVADSFYEQGEADGRARGRTEGVLLTLAAVIGLTMTAWWLAGRRG